MHVKDLYMLMKNQLIAAGKCLNMAVFLVVAPCSMVEVCRRFGDTFTLHRQDDRFPSSWQLLCHFFLYHEVWPGGGGGRGANVRNQ
jgi:hypothetical protein